MHKNETEHILWESISIIILNSNFYLVLALCKTIQVRGLLRYIIVIRDAVFLNAKTTRNGITALNRDVRRRIKNSEISNH